MLSKSDIFSKKDILEKTALLDGQFLHQKKIQIASAVGVVHPN